MIEYYDPHKRIWLKVIASALVVTFVWYDIAWAGDMLSGIVKPAAVSAAGHARFLPEEEVINYASYTDSLAYNKRASGIDKLLPSSQDSAQSGVFAPSYVQQQQRQHEDIIGQKQAVEDLSWLLRNKPKRQNEEIELKKKKSGPEGRGADYSLTDPDEANTAHNYNDFNNPATPNQTNKYDITMMDVNQWMQSNPKQFTDDKDGVIYWVGEGHNTPAAERLIMKIIYEGSGDNKIIKTILTGYHLTAAGSYEAKYRIDYTYSGKDITETRKYNISEGSDRLIEKSVYAGSGDDNRIQKIIYYGDDGDVKSRTDYKYVDNKLREVLSYEEAGEDYSVEDDRKLTQRTVFIGDKNKEIADYSQNYYFDEDVNQRYITETTVYYYSDGKRANSVSGQEYRYSKSKQVTFRSNPDTDADGVLTDTELASARKLSMLVYDDTNRLAGEETADYMVVYGSTGAITKTTVYIYKDGARSSSANYRECLESAATYYGSLDKNGDGEIDASELAAGIKSSKTFYDTEYRLKGEEVQDCTVTYLVDGSTIKDTTVYIYEGSRRAREAANDDRIQESATYWGQALNADGTLKTDAKLKSVTFNQFNSSTKRGEEMADVTFSYYRDGVTVKDTTVYYYKGNKRAGESTSRSGLERSATYWGDALIAVQLLDGNGNYDLAKIMEFMNAKFGMGLDSANSAANTLDAFLDYISGGNAGLKDALRAVLALSPVDLANKEKLVSALLALVGSGANTRLMELLLSIDMGSVTSKEDLMSDMLIAAGLDTGSAALIAAILSTEITDGMTKEELIDALKAKLGDAAVEALLVSIDLSAVGSAEELMLLLIKQNSGDKAAVEALINMLLGMDLDSFTDPEDLLNMMLLLVGSPALAELKDKLTALGADISGYTSAVDLLNALTGVSGTLSGFITDISMLIDNGTLSDVDVLFALQKLAAGLGAADLMRLILYQVPNTDSMRDALISAISGDNADLLNLLSKIDISGITTTQEFVQALMSIDTDADGFPDLVEILLGTGPDDPASVPQSLVYRYELRSDAKLKFETFYVIDVMSGQMPQSISDYTLNYAQDGLTIRETSVYYYEDPDGAVADVRASYTSADPNNSIRDSRKTRVLTYRNDARDPVLGGGSIAGGSVRKSETFYFIHSGTGTPDDPYTEVGSEVADYTYSYSFDDARVNDI
ncbi:MAG: hypothetical protein PHT32_05370, partial [Candidatus Omnitrophica bacterium]|nr:hypothetical protein [Candidatus Omnitrophota bacterium]